jgi:hypothetical protein
MQFTTDYSKTRDIMLQLEAGYNNVTIIDVTVESPKESDKSDQLKLTIQGVEAGINDDKFAWDYISIQENMAWKFQALFKAVGIPEGEVFDVLDLECLKSLLFVPFTIMVANDSYIAKNGTTATKAKVKSIYPLHSSNKRTNSTVQASAQTTKDDDNIPF